MKAIFYISIGIALTLALLGLDRDKPVADARALSVSSEQRTVLSTPAKIVSEQNDVTVNLPQDANKAIDFATLPEAVSLQPHTRPQLDHDKNLVAPQWVFVSGNRVNMRSGPGISHDIIGQFQRGVRLLVLERGKNWLHVRAENGAASTSGWMSARYLSDRTLPAEIKRKKEPKRVVAAPSSGDISRAKKRIIQRSIAGYAGSCPCPYNYDRAGRRCGKRSAWSRPGGYTPLCYESDVSKARVSTYLARQRGAAQ